jgi:hypothetical protein
MIFTQEDATTLLGFVVTILIPFTVNWLKQVTWTGWQKFGLALVLSVIGGVLTVLSQGTDLWSASLIQNIAVISMASQIIYHAAFKALNLERVLFPQSAVATEVKDLAVQQVADISREQAKDILSDAKNASVEVTVDRT